MFIRVPILVHESASMLIGCVCVSVHKESCLSSKRGVCVHAEIKMKKCVCEGAVAVMRL